MKIKLKLEWDFEYVMKLFGCLPCCSPALGDSFGICSRADVLHDEGVLLTAEAQCGVVGLAHSEEVRCRVASHQLEDVCNQGCGTKSKGMNSCEREDRSLTQRDASDVLTGRELCTSSESSEML